MDRDSRQQTHNLQQVRTAYERATIAKYDSFALKAGVHGAIFMNDGYSDFDDLGYPTRPDLPIVDGKYAPWLYQANLYRALLDAAGIPFTGGRGCVLDMSCGRGGGIAFIRDYYGFARCIGIDMNPTHIEIARNHASRVELMVGTATETGLESESVNAIVSVEALAYYRPMQRYADECWRILNPGGLLAQAAPLVLQARDRIDEILRARGFKTVRLIDVTRHVRMACAISKWRCIDSDPYYHEAMAGDEARYTLPETSYCMMIYRKEG